jgi:hypothetical protein
LLQRESFFDKKNRICCESIYFESDRSYLNGEVQSFRFEESVSMKKFSPPQMKEVSFPTPHTLHPTPSFKSGDYFYLFSPHPTPYTLLSQTFPLAAAISAHQLLETGSVTGKISLIID